ncbi:protein SMALL AUXIN UP-REGULATED RNA 12-like [Musa acuminata AAA Group]|uniref:protein SMALL AUXIN UP-REGULATED RNA 12-like n=1 Tax=Musa acuminata AAA Group TaxID=214697 RepID=UPI0031D5524E
MAMKKVEKIRQVVQLKQVMRRWRALSLRRRGEEDGSRGAVRPGSVAVYVGQERRRFVIPTRFLNLPVFAALLQRAEEEYGFPPAGGLALPCDPAFFRYVLDALHRDEPRFGALGLDAFLALFADLGGATSPCREPISYNGFSPLLPKTKAR